MDLIFNKAPGTGISEMRKYFSHISGMIDFEEIEPDVVAAQDEVSKDIGGSVMAAAIAHYLSDDYLQDTGGMTDEEKAAQTKKDNLVYYTQYAVCLHAYRAYASNNDATHTKNGRVSRLDTDNEQVNVRLIAMDDDALFYKFIHSMNRLITWLDRNQVQEWLDSDAYQQTRDVLLWNADLFHRFYPIDKSWYLFMLMLPMQREAQLLYIDSRLSAEQMTGMKAALEAGFKPAEGATGAEIEEMNDYRILNGYCSAALAKLTMAAAYKLLPIQMFPEKVLKQLWTAGNGAAAIAHRKVLISDIEAEAKKTLASLDLHLVKLDTVDAGEEVTDDTFTSVADRMDENNNYVSV